MSKYIIPKRTYWTEPTKMKAVRVEEILWNQFTKKAQSLGWKPSELAFLVADQRLQRRDKIEIDPNEVENRKQFTFRFPEKMWDELEKVANRINSSRSEVFRQILIDYLRGI